MTGDGADGDHNGAGAGGSCNSENEAEFEDGGVLCHMCQPARNIEPFFTL